MSAIISARDAKRLAAILARLGSPFENERAIAAEKADQAAKSIPGFCWASVLEQASRTVPSPLPAADRAPHSGWPQHGTQARLAWLYRHSDWLNEWEARFVADMHLRRRPPYSDKQIATANRIAERVAKATGCHAGREGGQ